MHTLATKAGGGNGALSSTLDLVLSRLGSARGSVVFDLDSTLLDNRPRQAAIVREFGESIRESAFEKVYASHLEGWDLRVAARNAGIEPALVDRRFAELRAFWKQRFFTSAYCRFDVVVPGAPEYVADIASRGRVIYLTGRPPEMRTGTEQSLRALGFPVPGEGDTVLLLKPSSEMHDDVWKEQAVERAASLGPVIAAFDNEPTHINGYRLAWPGAICVRVATDHSGRPVTLAEGVVEIPNFVR